MESFDRSDEPWTQGNQSDKDNWYTLWLGALESYIGTGDSTGSTDTDSTSTDFRSWWDNYFASNAGTDFKDEILDRVSSWGSSNGPTKILGSIGSESMVCILLSKHKHRIS